MQNAALSKEKQDSVLKKCAGHWMSFLTYASATSKAREHSSYHNKQVIS